MTIIGQTATTTTKVFKLVTGEEVIATARMVPEQVGEKMVVSKARMIALQPGPGGQVGIALIPWVVAAGDSEYEISPSTIVVQLSERQIVNSLLKEYTRQVTGLEIASASDLSTLQNK